MLAAYKESCGREEREREGKGGGGGGGLGGEPIIGRRDWGGALPLGGGNRRGESRLGCSQKYGTHEFSFHRESILNSVQKGRELDFLLLEQKV